MHMCKAQVKHMLRCCTFTTCDKYTHTAVFFQQANTHLYKLLTFRDNKHIFKSYTYLFLFGCSVT